MTCIEQDFSSRDVEAAGPILSGRSFQSHFRGLGNPGNDAAMRSRHNKRETLVTSLHLSMLIPLSSFGRGAAF